AVGGGTRVVCISRRAGQRGRADISRLEARRPVRRCGERHEQGEVTHDIAANTSGDHATHTKPPVSWSGPCGELQQPIEHFPHETGDAVTRTMVVLIPVPVTAVSPVMPLGLHLM